MNYSKPLRWLTAVFISAAITVPAVAQDKKKEGPPSESEMMAAMKLR